MEILLPYYSKNGQHTDSFVSELYWFGLSEKKEIDKAQPLKIVDIKSNCWFIEDLNDSLRNKICEYYDEGVPPQQN